MIRARENPFQTERIESLLKFQPEWLGETWPALFERWEILGRRVSVVGPHGSGKTTFLDGFAIRLQEQGYDVQRVTIRCMDPKAIPDLRSSAVVLLDLGGLTSVRSPAARWQLHRQLRRRLGECVGHIATRHWRGRRPILLRTRTTAHMLAECIRAVHAEHPFGAAEIAALHRQHRGNIRSALRECYDRVAG